MVSAAKLLSLVAVASLLSVVPAHAQNGRIRGVVRDAHNLPMQGATMRASGGTGATRRTVTNAEGEYSFTGLAAGTYSVSASLPGVRTQSQQVKVTGDADVVADFVMQAL